MSDRRPLTPSYTNPTHNQHLNWPRDDLDRLLRIYRRHGYAVERRGEDELVLTKPGVFIQVFVEERERPAGEGSS